MTEKEAIERLTKLREKQFSLQKKITDASRAVIPVLLDAGRTNSAKPLQELFFELDATGQEMHDIVSADPAIVLAAITKMMTRE